MWRALTLLVGCLLVPGMTPNVRAQTLSEELGGDWNCIWNAYNETIPSSEFVKVVADEHHSGEYSLRIGHPTSDTNLTIQRVLDVGTGAYEYNAYVKAIGELGAETAIYIKNGPAAVGPQQKAYSLAGTANADDWAFIQNIGNTTDMWVGEEGLLAIDIAVVCPAGSYLYVDDLNVYASDSGQVSKGVTLLNNGSFEKWDCSSSEGELDASKYYTVVDNTAKSGAKSLRIGHPTSNTNITLELLVPLPGTEWCAEYSTWIKVDGTLRSGSAIYIRGPGKTVQA